MGSEADRKDRGQHRDHLVGVVFVPQKNKTTKENGPMRNMPADLWGTVPTGQSDHTEVRWLPLLQSDTLLSL